MKAKDDQERESPSQSQEGTGTPSEPQETLGSESARREFLKGTAAGTVLFSLSGRPAWAKMTYASMAQGYNNPQALPNREPPGGGHRGRNGGNSEVP